MDGRGCISYTPPGSTPARTVNNVSYHYYDQPVWLQYDVRQILSQLFWNNSTYCTCTVWTLYFKNKSSVSKGRSFDPQPPPPLQVRHCTTVCKFLKVLRGSIPPDPSNLKIVLPEKKYAGNYMSNFRASSLKKFLNTPQNMKTIFKELFPSFLGLTSLYLVSTWIKSSSPSPKLSGCAPECEIEVFFNSPPPVKHAVCAPEPGVRF